MQTLTRRSAATSPGRGRGDHFSVSLSLLPVREKVAEGRMRGPPAGHSCKPSPAAPRRPLPVAGEVTTLCLSVPSPRAGEGGRRPDEGPAGRPLMQTLTRRSAATSPGRGRGDHLCLSVPSPRAGEGGRRPDEGPAGRPLMQTLTRRFAATSPGRGRGDHLCLSVPSPRAGEGGRRPDEGRGPPAGHSCKPSPAAPRRPLPVAGEVTTSLSLCPFSPCGRRWPKAG